MALIVHIFIHKTFMHIFFVTYEVDKENIEKETPSIHVCKFNILFVKRRAMGIPAGVSIHRADFRFRCNA